jgi:ubiquinone/menaquinone biosynthesis C-methylase UbiE
MQEGHFKKAYHSLVKRLSGSENQQQAMSLAVGGNYDAVGILERELLVQHGLKKDAYLIDVGCGSGRLTKPLAEYLDGRYLGLDVEQELVEFARAAVDRPKWRFEVTDGTRIPEQDGQADMVCFFSVFTHLLYEESYRYLGEAQRVLKPGGRIVFSFLEFMIPDVWAVFEANMLHAKKGDPLMMFVDRHAVNAWADHQSLEVVGIIDGNKPHIPLPHPVTFDNGETVSGKGKLGPIGQSVCVLRKPTG